jgi:16S rRNA processing protein RimM
MIHRKDVYAIGKFLKPHGIGGEVVFAFTSDVFERTHAPYWVVEMEGILVPFFVESCRRRSSESVLMKFEGVDTEEKLRQLFCGKEGYYPVAYADEDAEEVESWDDYLDYEVIDATAGTLGKIVDVDDSTSNVLFVVHDGEREWLIPVADDYFTDVDEEARCLYVDLPEGLLDL